MHEGQPRFGISLIAAISLVLFGCSSGPDYKRPDALADNAAPAFKESRDWKVATPGQADVNERWWTGFADEMLNDLVAQSDKANQTLKQAQAQYRQAQALVPAAQAAFTPTLGVSATEGRSLAFSQGAPSEGNAHTWAFLAGWEPDFWGRVGRSVEAAGDSAQASLSDLAAARLTVRAALVNDYLQLRMDDRQLLMYDEVITAYEKALKITGSQFKLGVATKSDTELANATLQSTKALATDLRLSRAQLEHAIAVLVGKIPAEFSIPALPADAPLPAELNVPAIVPSTLLERRPDIAAAERRVAAANANIGVVASAWYPKLSLTASYGNAGPSLGNWFYAPYEAWAVGGALAATLFDGGLRDAQNDQARAAFDAAAASYRQTVLNGFQEVEDNLIARSQLQKEIAFQDAAVRSSRAAERAIFSQYRAGTTLYTAVVTVQANALANERTALQLRARSLASSVALVKSIGGGWNAEALKP
jgi:NodT family efflux transporter outer membrane factor (OMF) lipoprotein